MSKFVIVKRTNRRYQFSLRADNGRAILISSSFSSLPVCLQEIELVKLCSQDDDCYHSIITESGNFEFLLKTPDGKVIGTSAVYQTKSARDKAMASVKLYAALAITDDFLSQSSSIQTDAPAKATPDKKLSLKIS